MPPADPALFVSISAVQAAAGTHDEVHHHSEADGTGDPFKLAGGRDGGDVTGTHNDNELRGINTTRGTRVREWQGNAWGDVPRAVSILHRTRRATRGREMGARWVQRETEPS